ncbi:glucose-6-phosphate dehydrogenase [Candidatus Peribacteria bacterium]|nr:glucose-6-phosphate dehydrogenase [Candidatus Peribacteria bacterium]
MKLCASSPFSIVLFGASGHLARLKIYPALYTLFATGRLPKHFAIVGFSRSDMNDEAFRALVAEAIRQNEPEPDEGGINAFIAHCFYQQGQYDEAASFAAMRGQLQQIEQKWSSVIRLAYFSVPPAVFAPIAQNLCKSGVHETGVPFRCIVEKPVGHDSRSFREMKETLLSCFMEEEIFLLDHYMGKEAVRNTYYLRYANPVLERLFKHTLIRSVEITAAEQNGIEQRAGYFENTGTFRDMFQSHLLMVMSLLTMRIGEESGGLRAGRMQALEALYLPPATSMDDIVLQGQYGAGSIRKEHVRGYCEEDGVAADSRTNTFAAMRIMSRASHWAGVPFFLRSGKRLQKKETRISILFQEPHKIGKDSKPNCLHIILQGEAGIRLELQTKMGGTEPCFRPLILSDPLVCMGDCLPEHGLLLLEAIHGKQQWFASFEEIQIAWRLIDPVQKHLERDETPLHTYPAGSNGPDALDAWIAQDGVAWMEI